ncbi:helix-turn-helix domain-containing protein [Rufibacter sp. XAAS-G3-1]|uniref:helix-turn-helix domain-containing protein n=1 Tax=Rufibacter sp. XAAS-G3-1 TaxID=2729134 RepID=UPI0015E6BF60|nr:helix-turn-helix transcriptional regulator [Rufibacter sp. XAAS-G3-1]
MDSIDFQAIIGQRLVEVRKSIKPKLSQVKLAEETNLNQGNIQRFEAAGRGTVENLLVILNYYLKKDINLNYILAEDNSMFTPKLRPEDRIDDIEKYFDPLLSNE